MVGAFIFETKPWVFSLKLLGLRKQVRALKDMVFFAKKKQQSGNRGYFALHTQTETCEIKRVELHISCFCLS